jgi:hypothetical protein
VEHIAVNTAKLDFKMVITILNQRFDQLDWTMQRKAIEYFPNNDKSYIYKLFPEYCRSANVLV